MKVIYKDKIIAKSNKTIVVEGNHYFPPESLKKEYFLETKFHSTCPWKGFANYYSINVDGSQVDNAAWFYKEPKDAAKEIKDHVAFYGHLVEITE